MNTTSINSISAKRLSWLDDAKMFAILAVIFYHCVPSELTNAGDVKGIIGSFNMPFFMFLAGFTSVTSLEKNTSWSNYWQYVIKIALHLLLPTFAIGILRAILTLDITAIGNEQWFLKMLFRYLLVFATINWLVHNIITFIHRNKTSINISHRWTYIKYPVFVLLMFFLSKTKLPEFPFYFLFGYFCKKHQVPSIIMRLRSHKVFWPCYIMITLSTIVLIYSMWALSRGHDFYNEPFWFLYKQYITIYYLFRQLCAFGWILLLLPLFLFLSKKYTWFSYCGSKSLGLYITHTFLLHIVIEQLQINYTNNYMGWISASFVAIALTLASLMLIKLFERNKYTHFIFLGGGTAVLKR